MLERIRTFLDEYEMLILLAISTTITISGLVHGDEMVTNVFMATTLVLLGLDRLQEIIKSSGEKT